MKISLNSAEKKTPAFFFWLLLFLLVVALFRKIVDFDIWYHLAIGREIFARHAIPTTEFLVSSTMGQPAHFPEWGFGLLAYVAYLLGGESGLSFMNALMGGLTLVLAYMAAVVGNRRLVPAVVVLVVLYWTIHFRLVYRPEMALYLAIAISIWCCEHYLKSRRVAWLLPLPFVTVIHGNMHPSVILAVGVVGAYSIQAVCDCRTEGTTIARPVRAFICTVAAMILAGLLNPAGAEGLLLPIRFAVQKELLKATLEFVPVMQSFLKWYFIAIASVTAAVIAFGRRRAVDMILFSVFAYSAFSMTRNIPLLALIAFVPVSRYLDNAASSFIEKQVGNWERAVFVIIVLAGILVPSILKGDWGKGPDIRLFPVKAPDAILTLAPKGTLFNFLSLGGYLAWRLADDGRYPYTDGRHYAMDEAFITHDKVFSADKDWQRILDRLDVSVIVTPALITGTGSPVPLMQHLIANDQWVPVVQEPAALTFMRLTALDPSRKIQPLPADAVWRQIADEARHVASIAPGDPTVHYTLGSALLELKDYREALVAFRRYRKLSPGDSSVLQTISMLEQITASTEGQVRER